MIMSVDTSSLGTSPSRKSKKQQRYQRLAKTDHDDEQEHQSTSLASLSLLSSNSHEEDDHNEVTKSLMVVFDDDDDGENIEADDGMTFTSSIHSVASNASRRSERRNSNSDDGNRVFRSTNKENRDIEAGTVRSSASKLEKTSSLPPRAPLSRHASAASSHKSYNGEGENGNNAVVSSPLSVGGASALDSNLSWDEWLDDDDPVVRRYHVDFKSQVPLPAEFHHQTLLQRIWRSFAELRQAARQRRAARLLNMPSESFPHRLHACIMTWLCDATDSGILLVAGIMTFWLLVGWVGSLSMRWWGLGVLLFTIRVSARRVYEKMSFPRRRSMRVRTTSEVMELPQRVMPVSAVDEDMWARVGQTTAEVT